jgi:hypothetical protein
MAKKKFYPPRAFEVDITNFLDPPKNETSKLFSI